MLRLCGLEILKLTHTASVFSTHNSFITSRASSHTRWESKILPNFFIISTKIYIHGGFFPEKKKRICVCTSATGADRHYKFFEPFASSLGSCSAP